MLECYAHAQKLIQLYGSDDYKDYVCNLAIMDMEQDRKTYESMKNDSTIISFESRDSDAATYIVRFETLIVKYFPHKISAISESDKGSSITAIIRALHAEYNGKYPDNKAKHLLVAKAIQRNKYTSAYDGTEVVYRQLCHFSHSTFSSFEDRAVRGGYFAVNNATKSLLPCLQFAYYCLKDCFEGFIGILEKL